MWFNNVTIDKGRWAGVEVNMPVVTAGGVVGRVVSTGPYSAQVMLLRTRNRRRRIVGQLVNPMPGSIKGMAKRLAGNALRIRVGKGPGRRHRDNDWSGFDYPRAIMSARWLR